MTVTAWGLIVSTNVKWGDYTLAIFGKSIVKALKGDIRLNELDLGFNSFPVNTCVSQPSTDVLLFPIK
jgi:hypothetical protein